MDNDHYIVKTLDNMPRFLFWGMDEFLVMVVPVFIGMIFLGFGFSGILCMISGPLGKYFYSKCKRKYPSGSLFHKLYWHLPHTTFSKSGKLKGIPPSHTRDIVL